MRTYKRTLDGFEVHDLQDRDLGWITSTYGEGFTVEADTASAAIRLGILQMAGSWVKYNGENICQGKDNILPLLKDNPELLEQLQKKVKEKVLSGVEEAEDKEIETLN